MIFSNLARNTRTVNSKRLQTRYGTVAQRSQAETQGLCMLALVVWFCQQQRIRESQVREQCGLQRAQTDERTMRLAEGVDGRENSAAYIESRQRE
ncbi:hypothetical protein Y032_0039g17 [Ancylostoma ceylanicum]|uniref:Uncharacterized protein n=1 Tax=Ancylostoma ceylanicum TaxID=53326 RepID=A0A016UJS3_9BILA|nr:hypothetical protein Y032_0039g17 [Ancylostoma ceylanicum]